jgi:hypothetical protein
MNPNGISAAPASRRRIIRAAIRDVRAARNEDSRMCRCGHAASGHLIRLSDGEAFHCCTDECGCKKYDEVGGEQRS